MRLTANDEIEGLQHYQLGVTIHICNPSTQRLRKEDHTMSLGPAWITQCI